MEEKKPYLEDVIIALQKSFSRVNRMTSQNEINNKTNNEGKETSRMVGDVEFSISTKVVHADDDKLTVDKEGHIDIKFSGTIDLDIDDDPDEEADE